MHATPTSLKCTSVLAALLVLFMVKGCGRNIFGSTPLLSNLGGFLVPGPAMRIAQEIAGPWRNSTSCSAWAWIVVWRCHTAGGNPTSHRFQTEKGSQVLPSGNLT